MNFLELCQRLRQEVGAAGNGPPSVTGQSGEYARMVGWVSAAWQEIQNERRWAFDWAQGGITLNTSETAYPLPTDFDDWIASTVTFGLERQPIVVVPWSELRPADRLSQVALAPDGTLHLNSSPATPGTLNFEYWRTPQPLTENTSVPRMPERFHMAIVYRAQRRYAYYESAPEALESAAVNESKIMQALVRSQLPAISRPEALA